MASYFDQVQEAASDLERRIGKVPTIAVVLGSGLGAFGESLGNATVGALRTDSALARIQSSRACRKLVVGTCRGRLVFALSGRAHVY
jgi:purine-nucleoside phosphorylase